MPDTLLSPGGVLFGTTTLGASQGDSQRARVFRGAYNALGIFGNRGDRLADLEAILKDTLHAYALRMEGCVAFFAGRT